MELLLTNLSSPVVLAFGLGLFARVVRSDLEIPPQIQTYLSIFLLLAIGLKGGVALRGQDPAELLMLLSLVIAIGVATTFTTYAVARSFLRDERIEAAALAAHYGSVSAVTFIAANQFVELAGNPAEGVMVALVVALEVPALLLALWLAHRANGGRRDAAQQHHTLREVFTGKSCILLVGGLVIGAITGPGGIRSVDAMYFALFQGVLMLFMIDMGIIAAGRLAQLRRGWWQLGLFATILPLAHGTVGVLLGHLAGLGAGGATVLGAMVSSASYIAAPATVRAGLPEADAGRCITAALGITFPFNLAIGIPLYASLAMWLAR